MTRILIPTLLTLACAASALAQTAAALPPGSEVRVTSPTASGRFLLAHMSADTLTLRNEDGGIVQVPMASVHELSVARGRRSGLGGAARGASLGLVGGAVTGLVIGYIDGDDPPDVFFSFSAEEKAVMFGALLGGAGVVVGAIAGAIAPGTNWEPVALAPVRAGLSTHGGVTLGYAIRF